MQARVPQPAAITDNNGHGDSGVSSVRTTVEGTQAGTSEHRPVLVVDDSRTVLLFVQRALGEAGIAAGIANTVDATMEAISVMQPHVILLDLSIAENNNELLIRRMRQEKTFQQKRVILFSNRVETALQTAATQLGAAGYLRKSGIARHIVNIVSVELAKVAGQK